MSQTAPTPTKLSWFRKIQAQIDAFPTAPAENSIALRVFVQLLVIIGIIAIDITSGVAEDELPLSYWAVPLSIIGAIFSWYRRHDILRHPTSRRNMALKFGLAIGMLFALFSFFGKLIGTLNDTRLVLAELLIQLVVLHSFDLPCRKDLGYSMVIGLILLGVAGAMSQTMAFGPLLIVFLVVALPTLILDYRSRLGLVLDQTKQKKIPKNKQKSWQLTTIITPKFFGLLLLTIIGLGLTIFFLFPRLPGYQLRTFPVSAPIDFQGTFDGRTIRNPGYIGSGNQNGQDSGTGNNKETGPGTLDSTFYYGFNTKINQNLRGEGLIPQEVMRVRSQIEGFWRVIAFDRYTGQGWEISGNDNTRTMTRPPWSFKFDVFTGFWGRSKTQEVIQSYSILTNLPNLIPSLSYAKELYFPTETIAIDPEGSMRSPVDLREGLTYTVISQVPRRDRAALNQARTTYSPIYQKHYLQIPPAIKEKVRQKTEEILRGINRVAKSDKAINTPYEKALYLAQYLKQNPNYKLQKEPPFLREDEDLVEAFLFGYKDSPPGEKITGGYADHFSTVLTMMLRSIGIPARLVAGYGPGEFNPFTGLYIVKNTDAFAMTEVYFPGYGWFAFNPIPGYPLIPPSVEDTETFPALKSFWSWVASWLPTPLRSWFEEVLGRIGVILASIIGWFISLFMQGWTGILAGLMVLSVVGFCLWLLFDAGRRWRRGRYLAKLPPIEGLYQRMLDILRQRGYGKKPAQTPWEYAQNMKGVMSQAEAEAIELISQAYVRWRYGNEPVNLPVLKQLLVSLNRGPKRSKKRNFEKAGL